MAKDEQRRIEDVKSYKHIMKVGGGPGRGLLWACPKLGWLKPCLSQRGWDSVSKPLSCDYDWPLGIFCDQDVSCFSISGVGWDDGALRCMCLTGVVCCQEWVKVVNRERYRWAQQQCNKMGNLLC